MTKLTTQGEKDSANTDLPQFYDPDDQVIDLDDETDIRKDPETETVEIDPDEAAVLAYFTNARRDQLEALPEPTKRDLQREEQIWAEPEDNLTLPGRPSTSVPPRNRTHSTHRRQAGAIPGTPYRGDGTPAPDPRTKPPRHAQRPATPGRGTRPGAAPHASAGLYPGRAPDERPTPAQSAATDPRRGP